MTMPNNKILSRILVKPNKELESTQSPINPINYYKCVRRKTKCVCWV